MSNDDAKSTRLGHEAASIAEMVESIIGCKWSLHVLAQIRRGVNRPGAIERSAEGLSAKVLGERLDKLVRFGIAERKAFPEVPPRVEYHLTPLGQRFVAIVDQVEAVQREIDDERRKRGPV
jgi:DNA-binding HxlR family transcriptional regulator